jgi:hypothetical protein
MQKHLALPAKQLYFPNMIMKYLKWLSWYHDHHILLIYIFKLKETAIIA